MSEKKAIKTVEKKREPDQAVPKSENSLLPQLSTGGKKKRVGFCKGSKKCLEKHQLAMATPPPAHGKKPTLALEERAERGMDRYVYSAEWDADCEKFFENLEQ